MGMSESTGPVEPNQQVKDKDYTDLPRNAGFSTGATPLGVGMFIVTGFMEHDSALVFVGTYAMACMIAFCGGTSAYTFAKILVGVKEGLGEPQN